MMFLIIKEISVKLNFRQIHFFCTFWNKSKCMFSVAPRVFLYFRLFYNLLKVSLFSVFSVVWLILPIVLTRKILKIFYSLYLLLLVLLYLISCQGNFLSYLDNLYFFDWKFCFIILNLNLK